MNKRKKKFIPWHELFKDECPKCGSKLMTDMFAGDLSGCACGFVITEKTKHLLIKRDSPNDKASTN